MRKETRRSDEDPALLESRLAYHFWCLRKDATDPALSRLERLALVRDRVKRIREIRDEIDTAKRNAHA